MRTCILFAGAAFLLAAAPSLAEEKTPPPKSRSVDVAVGRTVLLQMTSKKPIKTVINDNAAVVRVTALPDDPTTVMLTGLAVGVARLTLIDIDGKEESRDLGKPSGK
jgi:hypothetical protein